MRPQIVRHADADALCDAVAAEVVEALQAAIRARGKALLVLSGGRTPRGVYERMAGAELSWRRVTLAFGDERAVPWNDGASNYRMVTEALLLQLGSLSPEVLPIEAKDGADEAARRYAEVVQDLSFDVVLLGMGDDGHVASIFPATPEPHGDAVVIATTSPVAPHERVSMTLPRLARAGRVMMLVTGEAKAARLKEVWEQIDDWSAILPASRLAAFIAEGTVYEWHVDAAAGDLLKDTATGDEGGAT